jgi:predicted nuclease with TOPRIM domain
MAAESQGMQGGSVQVEPKAYKSPQRKLAPFFARSRDQWKEKCRDAKATLKQLKKKVQRGDARQRRQQERLQALAKEVGQLQAENRRLAAAVTAGEKKEPGTA